MSLIAAEAVRKTYRSAALLGGPPPKTVLRDVGLTIAPGECVGLLGRSGCGKSTLARLLLGLERPDSGQVTFRGQDVARLDRDGRRAFRKTVQIVFQDAISAVNPRHTVARIIEEPLRHLTELDGNARQARVAELLAVVGLHRDDAEKLPGQMSGGQLQRVSIARALAPKPDLIVLDEAVSNLDLVLQLQIVDMLSMLRRQSGAAFLFITHDLRLARRLCDRLIVMDGGAIVEEVEVAGFSAFRHAAAQALSAAVLPAHPRKGRGGLAQMPGANGQI
ncbi:MAG: nickel import ATP-binding protein NikE [Parvibaculaceae bacterium]